jgi:hypothetical protein
MARSATRVLPDSDLALHEPVHRDAVGESRSISAPTVELVVGQRERQRLLETRRETAGHPRGRCRRPALGTLTQQRRLQHESLLERRRPAPLPVRVARRRCTSCSASRNGAAARRCAPHPDRVIEPGQPAEHASIALADCQLASVEVAGRSGSAAPPTRAPSSVATRMTVGGAPSPGSAPRRLAA